MRHFIIDTDTASDDAVALVMAMKHPDVQIEAITLVGGNVGIEQGLQNALYTVELCGESIPVYRGLAQPMLRPLQMAQHVHGVDGMGDIGLPLSGRTPAEGHAVPVLIDTINKFAGNITLVTLAPLTNVALALLQDPSLASKVTECIVMGGIGQGYGNITPAAEFNIWVDPEAAKIVFESGIPITMVGWDISRTYATLNQADAAQLSQVSDLGKFCMDIQKTVMEFALERTKLDGFDLPDPIAMAVALDRSVITVSKKLYVDVEIHSELCRGQTVVDHLSATGKTANVEVVLEASRERFMEMLYDAVK